MQLTKLFCAGLLLVPGFVTSSFATPVVDWVVTNGDSVFLEGSEETSSPVIEDADDDSLIGRFPAVTLAVDDSIEVTGSFSITGKTGPLPGRQFRWGLFDAPNVPTTGEGEGYVGMWATISSSDGGSDLNSANGSTTNPFSGSAASLISEGTGVGGTPQYEVTYSLSMKITRIDDSQVSVSAMMTDGADFLVEWEETTAPASPASFTFDSVGILIGGTIDATNATFTDMEVSTGVPEPLSVRKIEYDVEGGTIAVTFNSIPGNLYTIETSPDLLTWTGDVGDSIEAAADAELTRFEFEDEGLETRSFFRVRENPPSVSQ